MGLKQTGLLLVQLQTTYLYLIKQARFLFTMLYDIIQRCCLSYYFFFCFWVHSNAGYWVWNRPLWAVSVLLENLWASAICGYLSGEARSAVSCAHAKYSMHTHLIRRPHYYGQFVLLMWKESPYIITLNSTRLIRIQTCLQEGKIKSRMTLIVVVVDSDWCFDNLCGSCLQLPTYY